MLAKFGLAPKAPIRQELVNLDMTDPEDRQKFVDAVNKHNIKGANINNEAVTNYFSAFEQIQEPLNEPGTSFNVETRANIPGLPLPSGQPRTAPGTTAFTTTGLAGAVPTTGGPLARTGALPSVRAGALTPTAGIAAPTGQGQLGLQTPSTAQDLAVQRGQVTSPPTMSNTPNRALADMTDPASEWDKVAQGNVLPAYSNLPEAAKAEWAASDRDVIAAQNIFEKYIKQIDAISDAQKRLQNADVHNELSTNEKQVIAEHYGEDSYNDVVKSKFVQDVITALTQGLDRVAAVLRNIIKRLQAGTLAAVIAINSSAMSPPIHFAIPAMDTKVEMVVAQVPVQAASKMSDGAKRAYGVLYPAMKQYLQENNKLFILTDKPNARMFVFNPDGSLLLERKVLLGSAFGDYYKGNTDIKANRITAAGLSTLSIRQNNATAADYDFQTVFGIEQVEDGSKYFVTTMHSVWMKEDDNQQRANALQTEGAADARISFGCINIDKPTFAYLFENHLGQIDGAKIFTVPDNPADTMSFINGEAVKTKTVKTPKPEVKAPESNKPVGTRREDFVTAAPVSGRESDVSADVAQETTASKKRVYREAAVNMDGMSVSDVQGVVNRIIDGWENTPMIQVVQFENQLPQLVQNQIKRDGVIRPQGLWDEDTQAVYLIADNLESQKDVSLTVAHEALGHYGLRTILGNNYSKVMNQMYQNKDVKTRADNKIARGMDKETAVEEVLAEMAEQQTPPDAIQKLVNILRQLMAKIGFPMKGVTNGEIKQLLENARQYVIEGKGEAGKGGMKVGKVFSGDAPIFYNKLAVIVQYAPKNLKDGASGKAWADWINSNAGKFGVKKEEIEWSGVNDLLALMEKSIKLTSKSVADMFNETGIKVNEVVYGGEVNKTLMAYLVAKEDSLIDDAENLTKEMLEKEVFLPDSYYGKQVEGYKAVTKNGYDGNFFIEPIHIPILEDTFGFENLKPEFFKEYKTKIKNIQSDLKDVSKDINRALRKPTRFDPYKTHGGENYTEIVLTLPKNITKGVYTHGHWPGVKNPIAHTRVSEFIDADGKRVLLVDEVQSDWGKAGIKSGFGVQQDYAQQYNALVARREEALEKFHVAREKAIAEGRMRDAFDFHPDDIEVLVKEYKSLVAEINNLRKNPPLEKAPFVQDTRVWTALVVKRLLRYAADNGINHIAFIDGQAAFERFPKDEDGNSTEKGMKTYYDQILPSVVKDVLNKLGANSKPTTSVIGTKARRGYSVFVDGELVDGPYENEQEATNAGADLFFSGVVEDSNAIKIKATEDPGSKAFTAFDIAPETTAKVKEGQAMFRSPERTPTDEGKELIERLNKTGGMPPKPSFKFRFPTFKRDTQQVNSDYEQNSLWEDIKAGAINIFSFDDAYNNEVRKQLFKLADEDKITMDQALLALRRVDVTQVVHRGQLSTDAINTGKLVYDPITNRYRIEINDANMDVLKEHILALSERTGITIDQALAVVSKAIEANRVRDVYEKLDKITGDITRTEKKIDLMQGNKKRTKQEDKQLAQARELLKKLKDEQELNRDRVQHMSRAQVQEGMKDFNNLPETKEAFAVWMQMRQHVIDELVRSGVTSEAKAEKWLAEMAYVPFFRDISEQRGIGMQIMKTGLGESMAEYGFKGSMLPVENTIGNMYQWMHWSYARAISNQHLRVALDQMKALSPDMIKEGPGPKGMTFSVYIDGQRRQYTVANVAVAKMFIETGSMLFPSVKLGRKYVELFVKGITRIPGFSTSQLVLKDTWEAMSTSGVKNPYGIVKNVFYEIGKTAMGISEAREELKARGQLSTREHAMASQYSTEVSQRLELKNPSNYRMVMNFLDRFSALNDNMLRQAVYQQLRNEGKTKDEAADRATEIFNYRRSSGSSLVQTLTNLVPFLNAFAISGRVAARTVSGKGITAQTRAEGAKTLATTQTLLIAGTLMYLLAVGDSEEYKRMNRMQRDTSFVIPGTNIVIPIRNGWFAMNKIIAEYTYNLLLNEAITDEQMFKDALYKAFKKQFEPPIGGVIVAPIGLALNKDIFNNRDIVNKTLDGLESKYQIDKNTSELAKYIGHISGMSPLKLDYFFNAFFGMTMPATAWLTNDLIADSRGVPRPSQTLLEQTAGIPTIGQFISKEDKSGRAADFYAAARESDKALRSIKKLAETDLGAARTKLSEDKDKIEYTEGLKRALEVLNRRENIIRNKPTFTTIDGKTKPNTFVIDGKEVPVTSENKAKLIKEIEEQRRGLNDKIMQVRKKVFK